MATAAENIRTARDNLAQIIADKTTAWVAAGCPPSYSIDGQSVSWNEWLSSKNQALRELNELLQGMSVFQKVTRGY